MWFNKKWPWNCAKDLNSVNSSESYKIISLKSGRKHKGKEVFCNLGVSQTNFVNYSCHHTGHSRLMTTILFEFIVSSMHCTRSAHLVLRSVTPIIIGDN
jgi:hypothetical protein